MFIRRPVPDFAAWKKAYDDFASVRKAAMQQSGVTAPLTIFYTSQAS